MSTATRILRDPEAKRVAIVLDGEPVEAFEGETLLAVLLVERGPVIRYTERHRQPRGAFCGMGFCMDCLVDVEGEGLVNACQTLVRAGMVCRRSMIGDGG